VRDEGGVSATSGQGACPTGKRRYVSEMEALQVLHRARLRGRGEQDYYKCDFCGRWHLTSQHRSTIGKPWGGRA
jgi:hypothetical protein